MCLRKKGERAVRKGKATPRVSGLPGACSAMASPLMGPQQAVPDQDSGLKCKVRFVISLHSKWLIQQCLGPEPLRHLGKQGNQPERQTFMVWLKQAVLTLTSCCLFFKLTGSDSRPTWVRTCKRQDGEMVQKSPAPMKHGTEPASRCARGPGKTGCGLHGHLAGPCFPPNRP